MNVYKILFSIGSAILMAFGFSSCSSTETTSPGSGATAYSNYDLPARAPSNPSNVKVKVSLSRQMAYVMEGSTPLLVMPVSVGKSATPTPSGNFRIFNKTRKRRANSHGYAYSGGRVSKTYLKDKPPGWSFKGTPMPYWCEFKSNYGFHTGWVHNRPNSHGCIRMYENLAPKFYKLVKVGTPVNIAYSQPMDSTLGASVGRGPDGKPLRDYSPGFYLGDGYFNKHKPPVFQ